MRGRRLLAVALGLVVLGSGCGDRGRVDPERSASPEAAPTAALATDAGEKGADRDAAALVAGDGRLPEGYVPAGRAAPGEIPPLPVLGGKVVLEIVAGQARARLTDVPKGSRAQEIGLSEGDVLLEVDGQPVGPLALAALDEMGAGGGQHTLRVRRTHGGIERIEIDAIAPAGPQATRTPGRLPLR